MVKYTDKQQAIAAADKAAAADGKQREVIYCYRSVGYYVDEAPALVRNFEERIYTTK